MNRSSSIRTLAAACVAVALLTACDRQDNRAPAVSEPEPADNPGTLVVNARIYPLAPADDGAMHDAMVFSDDGRVVAVGAAGTLRDAYAGAAVIDMEGRTVLPGLIDSHAHLAGLAQSFTRANLVGAGSKAEALDRLREFAAGLPDGAWLLGRGWDQNDWPQPVFPSRQDLDAVFPDRPVWLRRIDGHAGWANSRALAEVDRDLAGDWQEEGGFIHRDSAGEPTGIFIDRAMDWVERAVPPDSPELMSRALYLTT